MSCPSVILDISGCSLDEEDRELLAHPSVSGVILFTRNYESPDQLKKLTSDIHSIKPNIAIFVDQEGGRVQRFREAFSELQPMAFFGELYLENPEAALQGLRHQLITMIQELHAVGVTATVLPVLDLNYEQSWVIGNRSFGRDPAMVTALGSCLIDTLHKYGMPVTAKHFPGHGFVSVDSHEALPIDDRDMQTLQQNDLVPFVNLLNKIDFIMPAHIIYPQVDHRPVCFSPVWIRDFLKKQLGFKGSVMTDDLSMKAMDAFGDYVAKARAAIDAGCDLLLVCNNRLGAIHVVETVESCR